MRGSRILAHARRAEAVWSRFYEVIRDSLETRITWDGRREVRPIGPVAGRLVYSADSDNSEARCQVSGPSGDMREDGRQNGAGWRNIRPQDPRSPAYDRQEIAILHYGLRGAGAYAAPRIRGRLRRIFRKSRDFPANLRDFHRALARQSCAIYSDFSGPFGIRRIRPLRGAGWRNMRPPGPWSVA